MDTLFVDKQTQVVAAWLNDVNNTTYGKTPEVKNSLQPLGPNPGARTINSKFLDDAVSPRDFGAIGDGSSHPLWGVTTLGNTSTMGWTLAQWQGQFPHATSLTNELDWCAGQAAVNTGETVFWPDGNYLHDQPLTASTTNQRLYANGRLAVLNLNVTGPGIILSGSSGRQQVMGFTLVMGASCTKAIDYFSPQIQVMFNYINCGAASGGIGLYGENENTGSGIYNFGAQICYNFIHGSYTTGSRGLRLGNNSQTTTIFCNVVDNF